MNLVLLSLCVLTLALHSSEAEITNFKNLRACAQHTTGYNYDAFEQISTITHGVHLEFSVLTTSDAYLLLTTDGDTALPYYEIVIGGANNQISSIRAAMSGTDLVRVSTPGILSGTSYTSFWLRYLGETLEIGKAGDSLAFLHYVVGEKNLNTVGFSSFVGTSAQWIVNTGVTADTFTTANYAYTHFTLAQPDIGNGTAGIHLQFGVRANSDAKVLLSRHPFPANNEPVYEITIGGTNSGTTPMHTSVRRIMRGPELGAIATPDIISSRAFTCFTLDVSATGLIQLYVAGSTIPVFQYQDLNPPVYPAYYAFSSDYIFEGDWHEPCGCTL